MTVAQGQGRIGAPHDRIEGRRKVTGAANYAADFAVPNPLHARLVISTVGLGTITAMDTQAAEAVPGVRAIYSHANPLPVKAAPFFGSGGQAQQSWQPFAKADVRFHGETIALVVAETVLGAREAAAAVRVSYDAQEPAAVMTAPGVTREPQPKRAISKGDLEAQLAASAASVDARYETAGNTHNAMELFSTTAEWDGENVTVYVPSQWVKGFQLGIAEELGIDESRVRVVSPYVGGGFGGKGSLFTWTSLVAAASRALGRPVKLTVTREEGFTTASYRSETAQRVRLGAAADGALLAVAHHGDEMQSRADAFIVAGNEQTVRMYGDPPAIETSVEAVRADRQTPGFMRAPPEVPYFFAFESAVDELARELGMDPVELRIRNDVDREPVDGVPFTSRSLKECLRVAGERFGWADYDPAVGSMRDGDDLVGWGVAISEYPTQMSPCAVRVHLDISGEARVQVASHDVGTGAYTVIAQAAAERLGLPVERVRVELGDSRLPPGTIAGGSVSTASNVSVVEIACDRILDRLGLEGGGDVLAALEGFEQTAIEEYAEWTPPGAKSSAAKSLYNGKVRIVGGAMEDYAAFAFGAQFVEVRVNRWTREIRVPRLVGAFAAGRIMNEKTARSQYLGGMVWGIGHALMEATEIDPRNGAVVNDNIGEYHVPT